MSTRPLLRPSKSFADSHTPLLPPLPMNDLSQSLHRKPFPIRQNASLNQINPQSIPSSLPKVVKSSTIWDSASSDEETEVDANARRFFHQNMRAVDEELSKIDETPKTPSISMDVRTEDLLKRQKKAALCLSSNGGSYQDSPIETSTTADDFECVAMDLDSPNHRTQSESSDNICTAVELNNSKNPTNGPGKIRHCEIIEVYSYFSL